MQHPPDSIRAPGAHSDADGGPAVEYQPESGALGPRDPPEEEEAERDPRDDI
jgi:hypothetical protein